MQMYMPAPYCDYWTSGSLTCYVIGNLLIALAYYGIPFILMWGASQIKAGAFPGVEDLLLTHSALCRVLLWQFSLFIFFCGTGHIIDIIAVWHPNGWARGIWECGTAIVSMSTCLTLFQLKRASAASVAR